MKSAAILAAAAAGLGLWSCGAFAETINCTAINSLPATISVSGIYCLKKDLSTSMTSGAAITINTNNVTIDLNGFKLGGLAGGRNSGAIGILAQDRFNVEIRNGAVRGFQTAIFLTASATSPGGGHLVQNMLIDGSTGNGVVFSSVRNSVLRNSRIFDIGLPDMSGGAVAVSVFTSRDTTIENNIISNVRNSSNATGIYIVNASRTRVVGNAIYNVAGPGPVGSTSGSWGARISNGGGVLVRNNDFMNGDKGTAVSVYNNSTKTFCLANTINGYTAGQVNCPAS